MLITIKKGDPITVAEYNGSSLSSYQTHELFKCNALWQISSIALFRVILMGLATSGQLAARSLLRL